MKLFSYCQDCKKVVEVTGVETVKIENLSYVQRGRCSAVRDLGGGNMGTCNALIYKKVFDTEIIIDAKGQKTPQVVYVSKETPKRIWMKRFGQTVVDGKNVEILSAKTGEVKTVEDIRIELKNQRSKK